MPSGVFLRGHADRVNGAGREKDLWLANTGPTASPSLIPGGQDRAAWQTLEKGEGMTHGKAVRDALRGPTRALRETIPDVYGGYRELHDAALASGTLDAKTKELIALALAVSKQCDGCIAAHAHGAVQRGATPVEAAEAIGVAFLMNGGPATVYGARAFDAFQEFYGQRRTQEAA
jgi:AhpD family alkylhydroperoxidase